MCQTTISDAMIKLLYGWLLSNSLISTLCYARYVHVLTNPVNDEHHMTNGRGLVLPGGRLFVPTDQLGTAEVGSSFAKLFT